MFINRRHLKFMNFVLNMSKNRKRANTDKKNEVN